MLRGHGRTGSNVEKVAGRRNRSLARTRRSLGESNCKFFSEERQIPAIVLGNTEQRCIFFTLVASELDACFKLATILQSLESPDKRNHCPSAALSDSTPTIVFVINLQKDHRTNFSKDTCLPDSSAWSSSGINVMSQSRNRNKRTKSVKDNTSASRCMTVDASAGSLCESLSPLGSDDLVSDICRVEQSLKKSSKKKGKKKGKNYKRYSSNKDSPKLEGSHEESTCSGPATKTFTGCPSTCLSEQISENFSEKLSFPLNFIHKDTTVQKNDGETNNCADNSTTMQSCMSYDEEMEESKVAVSLSHGFAREEFTSNSTNELKSTFSMIESPESALSTDYVKQGTNCYDQSVSISMHVCADDGAAVVSVRDHLKNDISGNCRKDVVTRLPVTYKSGLDTPHELDSDFRRCDPSFHGAVVDSFGVNNEVSNACAASDSLMSHGVVNADSTERAQCSGQACSSNVIHPVLYGKRGSAARKSNVHTGKDNNYPVWQKVQPMENPGCVNTLNNVYTVPAKVDTPNTNSGVRERSDASSGFSQKVKTCKHLYPYEISCESSKSSEINVKKKQISVSKKLNHYSRKGSNNGTMNNARNSKIHDQQNVRSKKHDEHTSTGLSYPCNADSLKQAVNSTEKFDFCPSVQQQKAKECINEASLSGNTCRTAGSMTSSVACKQISTSISTMGSSGLSPEIDMEVHARGEDFSHCGNMHDELCAMYSTDNQHKKSPAECSHTENTDNNFGPVLQKWVPVFRKDAAMPHIEHVDNLTASLDECSSKLDGKNDNVDMSSGVQCLAPLNGMEVQCSSRSGDDADCSSSETDTLSDKLMFHVRTAGVLGMPVLNLQSASELKDQQFSKFETDLDKIVCAVNNSYKLHSVTGVHLNSGSPLAEFERFMRSASPVISLRHHNRICMTCPGKQEAGSSLCLHQLHNISLASLWQWYEEPGCYGLEVRAEDTHKSKRLRDGFVEFRAYFVPYLSAVQLFRQRGSSYASSGGETTVSSDSAKASMSSSNASSIPMFSILLPPPQMEVKECPLESTSSSINEFSNQSAQDINLIDEEPIFEYFEHAQPPQRRPLFEKIKELVNGDQSSNNQIYGDPLKLESLSLHDLHPASWYAVAWYPIYRIPEGNFRAAFLTYHSLGHFIHQSASSSMPADFARVISPVVGLQSYNAKKECWFRQRDLKSMKVEKGENLTLSPKLMEDRLRTLEHTASVMATAAVSKGNQRSINKHPDYNHFFSRW